MSVESLTVYSVQCSGWCQKWLCWDPEAHYWGTTLTQGLAFRFTSWAKANRAAAEANWFDGPQGEYAKCTCTTRSFLMPHDKNCRTNKPRLVPLCPPCRTTEENR